MGCKFSNKENDQEDQTEIVQKLTQRDNLKYDEEPLVRNEADVQIKISDLIGERKGNINDHYEFLKVLGEGWLLFLRVFLSLICLRLLWSSEARKTQGFRTAKSYQIYQEGLSFSVRGKRIEKWNRNLTKTGDLSSII